jgi:hypothetical protein
MLHKMELACLVVKLVVSAACFGVDVNQINVIQGPNRGGSP